MRAVFTFVLLLASLFVAAQANKAGQCILNTCPAQVSACYEDPLCLGAAECVSKCHPADVACAQSCAQQANSDGPFHALAQCATQCLYSATTDLFGLLEPPAPQTGQCTWLKRAACAVDIATAVRACDGPVDLLCIIAALRALDGCAQCYCEDYCLGACKELQLC